MVLCDNEIRAMLRHEQIVIDPMPTDDRIGTTSVDLTLGSEFKIWAPPSQATSIVVEPTAKDFFGSLQADRLQPARLEEDGSVILRPGKFLLAKTRERVNLKVSSRVAARVEGRSSLARIGVGIHVTAPTIHAGFRGTITLEVTNSGEYPVRLSPGMSICQLIFELVYGTPSKDMEGIFQDQATVTGRGSA